MAHFSADLDASELVTLLKKKRTRDLTETMSVVAEQLVAAVQDQFESAGGGKWPALAESTIARRGESAEILKDSGALAASQNPAWGPDFAEVSTDKFYAVFHVSDAPRKIIPLRNFYDLPEDVYTTAVQTILEAVVK